MISKFIQRLFVSKPRGSRRKEALTRFSVSRDTSSSETAETPPKLPTPRGVESSISNNRLNLQP